MFQNIRCLTWLCLVFFASCKKDKPNTGNVILPKDSTARVLIVCEGSLGNGNAEMSLYLPKKDSVYNDVYNLANNQVLGDIFQSLAKIDNQYFLCINNSSKIVVLNPMNWLQVASINILKPRYMLDIGNHRAYVGSLYSNKIYVVNTLTFAIETQIQMPYQNVEGMLLSDGYAYVCCWDTACNQLYRINTATHALVDSILLSGNAPHEILKDKVGKIWVMAGNAYKSKLATLSKIDVASKTLEQTLPFAKGVEAIKPCFNSGKDSLYFIEVNYSGGVLNNGIYRMPITATNLPNAPFISCQPNQYFWALSIEPVGGNIYMGDPKGFVQKSTVLVYNAQAQLQRQFAVGIGVSSFYFD
ncbi:MAG: hypothetical protein QM530_00830 [Phycisphaerales bacterium]|nr:hypothetical protein [Phycisphaerales bacterium]